MKTHPILSRFVIAILFTIAVVVFEAVFLPVNSRQNLLEIRQDGLYLIFTYILTFCMTLIFIWASFNSRIALRIIYFFVFALPLIIQYTYWNVNKNFIALHDLDTAINVGDILYPWSIAAVVSYFNPIAIFPISLYGYLLHKIGAAIKSDLRIFVVIIYFITCFNFIVFYYQQITLTPHQTRSTYYLNATSWDGFIQVMTQAFSSYLIRTNMLRQQFSRETLPLLAPTPLQNNIVYIIDESLRSTHLSINGYTRPTTPFLEQLNQEHLIYNWGTAVSAATCSEQSVASLLTGVYQFPDVEYRVRLNPTILQYAKARGYHTYLFDGEANGPRPQFTIDDYKIIDEVGGIVEFGNDYQNDIKIATKTRQILTKSVGNFIVILKNGVHFPYNSRYPADATIWTPTLPGKYLVTGPKEQLINSYDNAVRYNVNLFFEELLQNRDVLTTTIFLYTSDHAQTLGDNGVNHSHCNKTPSEAEVPLMLITAKHYSIDKQFRASHHNIFATLLDLMDFPTSERHYDYPISLLKAKASDFRPRYFLYGSLYGIGTYEVVLYDK